MRVGENPAKFGPKPAEAAPVTAALITHIPFQAGYFQSSLDVLKLSLASLLANTPQPFDLFVFDNGSCPEVVNYLAGLRTQGAIQYLVLSERNVGKVGAWNFIFAAAPGEYVAYADSDVYFYPGWLEAELEVIAAFDRVGMVSGLPAMHVFGLFTESTLRWAEADPETVVERGQFMPDEWIVSWGRSLGREEAGFLAECRRLEQVRLTRRGVAAYAVATHFQFLARRDVLRRMIPLANTRPLGAARVLDEQLDAAGFVRLSVSRPVVHHLGNTLTPEWQVETEKLGAPIVAAARPRAGGALARLLRWRPIWRLTLEIYHRISRLIEIGTA